MMGSSSPDSVDAILGAAAQQLPYFFVVCEGPDLRIVAMNAYTQAVAPTRNMVGRTMREAYAVLLGQQWIEAYEQVYRTEVPLVGQEWRAHLPQSDGTLIELWANFTITPWRDADGHRRGVIAIGQDVTEVVQARMKAERQNELMRQQYQHTRDVMVTLQRELLPAALPVLPGAELAAIYLPADLRGAAGGDWYDAIVRPDGTLGLVVGDVVGHGVTAAAAMSQLRAILHERLSAGVGLVEALTAVDAVAIRSPSTRAATVCAAIVDTEDGHVEYCTAGHPPPLVVNLGGNTRYLDITGSGPLGTGSGFAVGTTHLDKTDLVMLYTDGILERPGRALVEATVELATVAADAAAGRGFLDTSGTTSQRVCALTSELLLRATGHADDVTLLVAQRRSRPTDLSVTFAARPTSLREMRMTLSQWMASAGIEHDAMAVQHAVGELAANVVEHAYRDAAEPGELTLTATVTDHGETIIAVVDDGRWRPAATSSDGTHGRGLSMANQLVDAVDVEHTDAGTTATVRHRLRQPAALTRLTARPVPMASERGPAESGRPLLILQPPDHVDRILVDGPLDANTAGELRFELNQRTRGGTASLAVDLTGVTHLASAAVAVLHEAVAASARHDQTLRLFAPPGTVAQHILSVAGLSHSSTDEATDGTTMTRADEPPDEGP